MNRQSRFDAGYRMLWDDPEGWYRQGGGRGIWDGTRVHPWWIHVDV